LSASIVFDYFWSSRSASPQTHRLGLKISEKGIIQSIKHFKPKKALLLAFLFDE
jgi:hypothetical protein